MAEVVDFDQNYSSGTNSTQDGVECSHSNKVQDVRKSNIATEIDGKVHQVQMTFDQFKEIKVSNIEGSGFGEQERRKSTRVVPKRKIENQEEDLVGSVLKKKKKGSLKKAAPVKKNVKTGDPSADTGVKTKLNVLGSTKKAGKVNLGSTDSKNLKLKLKSATSIEKAQVTEMQEPQLNNEIWASCVPLLSTDFKNNTPAISRLKFPHMKAVPFAKDLIMFMNFINKFNQFLPSELWSLSIQDLQVGLDLYTGDPDEPIAQLYQDCLLPRELKRCQDLVNLFFLCLMKLTLNIYTPTNLGSLADGKKPFDKLVQKITAKAADYGYPREWMKPEPESVNIATPQNQVFLEDKLEPVDKHNPDILKTNTDFFYQREHLDSDKNPLFTPDLDKTGLRALTPIDRLIMLRTLVQWCISNSDRIHAEIYRLSHLKKDPSFGVQTAHAPRYLVQGVLETRKHFKKLCKLLMQKLEIRSKKKHVKKKLESGKQQQLSFKLKLLQELKDSMKEYKRENEALLQTCPESDEKMKTIDPLDMSFERDFAKWCELLDGEVPDNPMENPFEDEVYKLRNQEFFIGRVPHIGDFYLPRLFTYQRNTKKNWIPSTFVGPNELERLYEEFQTNKYNPFNLLSKNAKMMSLQFKLYYHYTPALIKDLVAGKFTKNKVYWYEMCYDTQTLQDFIKLLEFKLVKDTRDDTILNNQKKSQGQQAQAESQEHSHEQKSQEHPNQPNQPSKQDSSENKEFLGYNTNPLPKESKFNKSRAKIQILKEYLEKIYFILLRFEQLKNEYGDVGITDRNLRRSQRNKVNYTEEYQDDIYEADYKPNEDFQDFDEEYNHQDSFDGSSDTEISNETKGEVYQKTRKTRGQRSTMGGVTRAERSARRRAEKI